MKKSYVWGVILAVIVIGGLMWIGTSFKLGADQPKESMIASEVSPPVRLTTIRSEVFAFRGGTKVSTVIDASTTLSADDSVKTGNVGRALLEDDDFKTVIDHDSELSIADVADQKASLELNSGSVWLRVEKVFGKGQGVEVVTPNAVAAVRGTSFGVSYHNGISILIVASGTVSFSAKDDPSSEIPVSAGTKAVIGTDGKIKLFTLDPKDKATEWFKYNNHEDDSGNKDTGNPDNSSGNGGSNSSNNNGASATGGGGGSSAQSTTTATTTLLQQTSPANSIHITSINPGKMTSKDRAELNIYGSGFSMTKSLMIGKTPFDFSIINDTNLFTVASNLLPGTYDVTVSGQNSSDTLPGAFIVSIR